MDASPSLSSRESALVASWERERRRRVTLGDLRVLFGRNATAIATRLARKGALQRVGRGIYSVRPVRAFTKMASASAPVLVAQLLADERYYLGGLWGLTFHRLTTQQYMNVLDAFTTKRRRDRELGAARVTFHTIDATSFAGGIVSVQLEDFLVNVSDAERTVLDLLDYPGVAGGIAESLRHAEFALPKLDHRRLIRHAIQASRLSTCQRVGVLLERAGASAVSLSALRRHVRQTGSRLRMDPERPSRGHLNVRWNVIENDEGRLS